MIQKAAHPASMQVRTMLRRTSDVPRHAAGVDACCTAFAHGTTWEERYLVGYPELG